MSLKKLARGLDPRVETGFPIKTCAKSVLALGAIPRFGRRELFAVAVLAILVLAFLPIVVRKAVWLGQGDVEVFFRAGWAIWSGYPL